MSYGTDKINNYKLLDLCYFVINGLIIDIDKDFYVILIFDYYDGNLCYYFFI
jgi:hypothetical protein